MLKLKGVSKHYGETVALHNVSFEVDSGEIAVLLGPNGAGKSTAIKSIAGLLQFDGEITIGGHPCKSLEAKRLLGYVPEVPSLYDLLTIEEHVTFVSKAYSQSLDSRELEDLYQRFDLMDKKEKLGKELSKGMQQKTSILCAVLTHPKVILFDEPMIGLDPHAIKELKALFLELKAQGCAVLVSTHVIDSVAELWDKVLIMQGGSIVAVKTKKDLEESGDNLEDFFFETTEKQDRFAFSWKENPGNPRETAMETKTKENPRERSASPEEQEERHD